MYVVVVGGNGVGESLAEIALREGHDVTIVEPEAERAKRLAQSLDARVLQASIAEGGILEEADAASADALVAATGDDPTNLMAMVLGLEAEVPTLVSIVNEASHRPLFERLGVHVLLDPEVIVARHLYGILRRPELEDTATLPAGGQAFEVKLEAGAKLAGATLAEAREKGLLGKRLALVWLRREDDAARIPDDATRFEPGDRLTLFSPEPISKAQLAVFRP